MTFPLGSLQAEGGAASAPPSKAPGSKPASRKAASKAAPPVAAPASVASLRTQFAVIAGGVLWLLALLALVTHHPGDAAFSTSGSNAMPLNKVGALGAWFSDLSFVLLGYSAWWMLLISLRTWLGSLARLLRGTEQADQAPPVQPRWWFWAGVALLLCSSASLEWTRLYQWEPRLAGAHAGGVLGYVLGPLSMKLLGFVGSGVLWITGLVAGVALAFRFSWVHLAEKIGAWVATSSTGTKPPPSSSRRTMSFGPVG